MDAEHGDYDDMHNQAGNTNLNDIAKEPLVPLQPQDSMEELSLHTLPTELFLHICSFLRAKFVIRTLSQVCRLFRDLIMDDTFWKVRMKKRWPKPYPVVPVNEKEFDWKQACICREDEWRRWTEHEKTTTYFHLTSGCFASIDAVHLMQNGTLLATGSRDRNLSFLDLKSIDPHNPDSIEHCSLTVKMGAHKGWIWSFSSLENLLVSGSWDTFIKFWDISAPAGPTEIRAAKFKSAVLCCHLEQDILFAGAFDKKVYHIDPRVTQVLQTYSYHSQPVLCLAADPKYLVTGSEDHTIVVFDRSAGKVFKTVKMESYPMSLWMGQDQLWVGDRDGKLSLYDTTDGDFNIVQTYDVGHKSRMSGVICTQGSILTCSSDKQDNAIRVLEPTLNPGLMATLLQPGGSPVAQIDYQNEVLVSANSDVSVGLWIPKPDM